MSIKGQNEVPINLKEFDMSSIKGNNVLLFLGKRNTGKSVLVLDYLYYNQDLPYAACISPTDDYNLTFRPHVPSKFIYKKATPLLLKQFLKRQKRITLKKTNAETGRGDVQYSNVDNRGILIMDDCLADIKDWKNDETIKWIFTNGRHVGISLVMTMQYQLGIPPLMRTNTDYIFICKETKTVEKKKLYSYYAGMFDNYDMFNQIFNTCTSNYGCMVIDNTTNSEKLEDQVYWYKADIHDSKNNPFKICYEDFWQNNDDYIPHDIDSDEEGTTNKDNMNDDYHNYIKSKGKVRYNVSIVPTMTQEQEELEKLKSEQEDYNNFQKTQLQQLNNYNKDLRNSPQSQSYSQSQTQSPQPPSQSSNPWGNW